ncbi:hypothetical protein SS50377_21197 [Spironucleus salmonicida]|uniref:Uncharacterized protein n=1 Tax=Spironucleus salmonicida TaxID=348837 RepID=A0A9P8M372_9EUKA|nr:hypothetical protein SS50377_21197 [Spironucleus salmonicida]
MSDLQDIKLLLSEQLDLIKTLYLKVLQLEEKSNQKIPQQMSQLYKNQLEIEQMISKQSGDQ